MKKEKSAFDKVLSQRDVLALAFGAMIGWGWVVLSGEWILKAGTLGAIIAFVIGGIMVFFVGLTYAELTSAMPKCGGEHEFSKRALGRNASFVCTWAIILGYISVVAFEAVAFPTVVEYIFPNYVQGYMYTVAGYDVHLTWVIVAVVASIIITIINYFGAKPAAVVQGIVVAMVALVGLSFFGGSVVNGDTSLLNPLFADGFKGIMSVAIMTPFMFVGFDVIPQAAEEINIPPKKIGKILLLSVVMAIAWYVIIIIGLSMSMGRDALGASLIPAADGMGNVFFNSKFASDLMIIAGMGGILTSWNSFFVGGSRAIYALANSKQLPAFLGKLHPKYKTPTNAVLLIGLVSSFAPLLGRQMLVWLSDAGGLTIVVSYLMVAISFLVLRKKEPELVRPYKVKNGKLVSFIAIALSTLMMLLYIIPGAPSALVWPYEWMIILGWIGLGVIFYLWAKVSYKTDKAKVINIRALESVADKEA